jgi:beta-xylosidase
LTSTEQRDPDILLDDDGGVYMVFGTFNYYMVRLGQDMLSLAEEPRPVVILNPQGPYGAGRTDDKPSLHKRNSLYYLSWSSYYATARSVYGPFEYRGCIIDSTSLSPQFHHPAPTCDRHGNFFQFNGQSYYTCNDASQAGRSSHFRDSVLAYVHYRDDGTIAPIRIEPIGTGQYDAASCPIQAANYFSLVGGEKRESPDDGFEVQALANGSQLRYPHIKNVQGHVRLTLFFRSSGARGGWVEARCKTTGRVLGTMVVEPASDWNILRDVSCEFPLDSRGLDLLLAFMGPDREFCRLCRFSLSSG